MRKQIKLIIICLLAISCLEAWGASSHSSYASDFTVTGLPSGDMLKNVQKRISLAEKNNSSLSEQQIFSFIDTMKEEIKQAMAPYGYFNPIIVINQTHNSPIQTHYQIQAGSPTRISTVNINIMGDGKDEKAFKEFKQQFPLHKNDILVTPRYEEAKKRFYELATKSGYPKANLVKSEINVDPPQNTASINILADTNKIYYFGLVHFKSTIFNDSFLQRFVPFRQGQRYDNKQLQQLQQVLMNSGYFQQVTVTPQFDNASNQLVPIEVNLTNQKQFSYTLGAGYGTDTSIRGTLGFESPYLNSYGNHFQGYLKASPIQSNLHAAYIIPGRNPVTDQYNISAETQLLDYLTGDSRNIKLALGQTTRRFGGQQILSINLLNEKTDYVDQPSFASTLLIPSYNWSRVDSDNTLNPSRGYRIRLNVQGAKEGIVSNVNFLQMGASAKFLSSFHNKDYRFIARGDIAHTFIDNPDDLPLSIQLLTGGSESIRGYAYNQLGPGRDLVVGSLELQRRIRGNIYGDAFYDIGTIGNSYTADFKQSPGIGLTYLSPIGAINLAVAKALNDPDSVWRIVFSIGPDL